MSLVSIELRGKVVLCTGTRLPVGSHELQLVTRAGRGYSPRAQQLTVVQVVPAVP